MTDLTEDEMVFVDVMAAQAYARLSRSLAVSRSHGDRRAVPPELSLSPPEPNDQSKLIDISVIESKVAHLAGHRFLYDKEPLSCSYWARQKK